MTWKDGGPYGRLCREVTTEDGSRVVCAVWTRQFGLGSRNIEPWPEGEENFHLILRALQMLEALCSIRDQAECYLQPLTAIGSRARWEAVRDRAAAAIEAVTKENNCEDELV